MRLLQRYVLIELLKVFAVTLAAMTALMLLVGVVREASDRGLGLAQIVLLIPYVLPDSLRFAVPGTLLFATCSVYGRMAGSNEVVAVKSVGISPMAVMWPTLALATLLSLITVWLNDVAVSWGRNGARRVVIEAVEEIAYGMLRSQKAYSTDQFSINVKEVDGRVLVRPMLTFQAQGDTPAFSVTAQSAELRSDLAQSELTVRITSGTIDFGDGTTLVFDDTQSFTMPLSRFSDAQENSNNPSWMALRDIPKATRVQRDQVEGHRAELAVDAAYALMTGDLEDIRGEHWDTQRRVLDRIEEIYHKLRTEPHRRWANGFSCLCFAMIGAPMAIRMRKSDFMTTFGACFLPILIGYYPLLAYGVGMAKSGALPPTSVWLGNLILTGVGCALMRLVTRY